MRLPATIGLVFWLVLLWLVGALFSPKDEPAGNLSMSVGNVILEHIRPWVYITAGFYHPHLLQLLLVVPCAFSLTKRVEPELGALNVVRLLVFVNTLATLALFAELFSLYIIFRAPIFLKTSLSGFAGGFTALLVAYMKPTPHATSAMFPTIKLRFYPLLAVLFFSLCTLVAMGASSKPLRVSLIGAGPYSVLGAYLGWYYLRFFNKNADRSVGDISEEFGLVVLFPDCCASVVGPVANFSFSVAKLCGYFKNRSAKAASALPIVTDASNDPIAERRKARAMKALDEKLAKLASAQHALRADPNTESSS
ncbi:hypothetical protein PINS_up015474 [Pythium insidiosum]|nr:hypothetical protein PINS_up015474 [Pythium insidiosum]